MKLTHLAAAHLPFSPAFAGLLVALALPAMACSSVSHASPPVEAPATPTSPGAPGEAAPALLGPQEADMRPGPSPLDLRTRTLPSDVERAWLAKDVEMIWRVRSVLPPSQSASSFLRALAAEDTEQDSDLGFGLHLHSARVAGGYTTCWFTLASQDDAIVALRAECSAQTPASEGVGPTLQEALGKGFTLEPGPTLVARAEYRSPAGSRAERAALDRALGAQVPVALDTLPPAVREAYERLTSPLDELAVGSSCGIAGSSPAGREAMLTLVNAKRVDLLRNVLRGANAGGRIYAAQGLHELDALSAQDQAVVSALSSSAGSVTTCGGCMFENQTVAEALELELD